jgi:enoyl-CoA hydratase/carnithine racemase
MSTVIYQVTDKVARITMNRPDKLNAINVEMRNELYAALVNANNDPDVWILVIGGAGGNFSPGHDLTEIRAAAGESGPTIDDLYLYLANIYKPTVSSISGYCLAQGGGIALCTDIRIATENARFGWPQVRRGISSISGPALLAHHIPMNFALEALLTGELISAEDALRWGMLNRVVPGDQLDATVDQVVAKLRANAPLAMRAVKEATVRGRGMGINERVRLASLLLDAVNATEDAKEGIAAFVEKRAPVWQGR